MKKLSALSIAAVVLLVPLASFADEVSKPIVGKAPPAAVDGDTGDKPKAEAPASPLFDTTGFERDPASDKIIASMREKCFASPMSREGMTEQETKICNAAVARLAARGKAATGSILAELNDNDAAGSYYERTRLYYTLAKTDDPKVEDVLLRGYARLATDKSDQLMPEGQMIETTLGTMNGVDPVGAEMLGDATVTDDFQTATEHVMIWRQFQRDHAEKAKGKMRNEALARARADKKSNDPKKLYLALSTLAQLAPNEALPLIEKVVERTDLKDDEKAPFYGLESAVYGNPAYVYTVPN